MGLSLAEIAGATDTETATATIDLVDSAIVIAPGQAPGQGRVCSAIIVHAEDGWTALCEELEVAADGDDGQDALLNLLHAVEAVLKVDRPEDRPQTPAAAVLEFIDSHQGPEPIQVFSFKVKAPS